MNLKELKNKGYQEIADMARIGFIEDLSLEVYVRTDDGGNEPHVHVWDRGTKGKEFSTAISLKEPKYTPHGNKYKDTFNAKQKKAFVEFMKTKRPPRLAGDLPRTGYELCVVAWNDNNSNMDVEIQYENGNPIIPDYSLL